MPNNSTAFASGHSGNGRKLRSAVFNKEFMIFFKKNLCGAAVIHIGDIGGQVVSINIICRGEDIFHIRAAKGVFANKSV